MMLKIIAWGVKHGPVPPADFQYKVLDLLNPHNDRLLRDLNGNDPKVKDYVRESTNYKERLDRWKAQVLIVNKEQKTVVVACMGGKHRSVVVANDLADMFRRSGHKVQVETPFVEQTASQRLS